MRGRDDGRKAPIIQNIQRHRKSSRILIKKPQILEKSALNDISASAEDLKVRGTREKITQR